LKTYNDLLAKNLVMPDKMEIMIMKADGSGLKQLTSNGAANFAPYFLPNGRQIIFASDMNNKSRGIPDFDLYVINRDGTGLQQITFDEGFDAFPMLATTGKKLVWASSRNGAKEGDIDIFIADWAE
jgi:Tol biopolymer transport system component